MKNMTFLHCILSFESTSSKICAIQPLYISFYFLMFLLAFTSADIIFHNIRLTIFQIFLDILFLYNISQYFITSFCINRQKDLPKTHGRQPPQNPPLYTTHTHNATSSNTDTQHCCDVTMETSNKILLQLTITIRH